jgi:protein-S-isoprenylcysteine O-methyltransferase Ste14
MHHFIEFRPPRIALSFVALAALLNLLLPVTLHARLPLAATITAGLGLSLMLRAWWLFKRARTAICPTHTATVLLTHDVYAISRNPMYLGMLLMLAGPALATGHLTFYIAAAAYAVVIDRVFVRHEERKSLREFGAEYAAYSRQVRRWL